MSRPPISFESGDPRYHNLLLFAMFGSFWSFQIIVWGLALGPYISKGFAPAAGPSLIGCRLHIAASWLHLAANFEDFGLDFRCRRGVLNPAGLVLGSLGRTSSVWGGPLGFRSWILIFLGSLLDPWGSLWGLLGSL